MSAVQLLALPETNAENPYPHFHTDISPGSYTSELHWGFLDRCTVNSPAVTSFIRGNCPLVVIR